MRRFSAWQVRTRVSVWLLDSNAAARFLLQAWLDQQISRYPVFAAVDRAIARNGLYIVFLLRLSPVIPFNLLNYALALTV
jgi:uncharacterized membrane protein YdjX (TVP38/TMEM64 family)